MKFKIIESTNKNQLLKSIRFITGVKDVKYNVRVEFDNHVVYSALVIYG